MIKIIMAHPYGSGCPLLVFGSSRRRRKALQELPLVALHCQRRLALLCRPANRSHPLRIIPSCQAPEQCF